jgi:hypothetical protein
MISANLRLARATNKAGILSKTRSVQKRDPINDLIQEDTLIALEV